jgi:hypothetical protein
MNGVDLMKQALIRLSAKLQRKDPRLPVFIDVPGAAIAEWRLETTTTVEGSANGHAFGRRSIKYHTVPAGDWFIEFTKAFAEQAGLKVGDRIEVELALADMTLPAEIAGRIAGDAGFAKAWSALKPNHVRAAIELYLEAKTPVGRTARLEKIARTIPG